MGLNFLVKRGEMIPGPIGPRGPRGPAGLTGLTGLTGLRGPIGLTGGPGETGPQGNPGAKGDPGKDGVGNRTILFEVNEDLAVEENVWFAYAMEDMEIIGIKGGVKTAPDGDDIIIDIYCGETSVYTVQADRFTILDGDTEAVGELPAIVSIGAGDQVSFSIDQVGSTTPGSGLSLSILCKIVDFAPL